VVQSRGILIALRAAAIVIIATGLNDVLAGALPRYEPLYLYLAAIALVVILDGLLLGALTAIGAIAFYALLFMPRPAALSQAVLVPFGAALATVVAASIVRGVLRVRTRSVAVAENGGRPTPLLMAPIVIDHGEVLTAIDELRDELRGEFRSAISDASHEEARRAEATARTEELRRLFDMERGLHTTAATRVAELERALADQRNAREAGAARLMDLETALSDARTDATARADELRRTLEHERGLRATGTARVATLERSLTEERTARESESARAAEIETALAAARAEASLHAEELVAIRAAADELRRTVEIERARADGERGIRTTAVERITELERASTVRESESVRLSEQAAELQQHVAEERALRERLERDAQSQNAALAALRGRLHGLEQTLEAARLRAADQERLLRTRIEELEESLVTDLQLRDHELTAQRARLEEMEAEQVRLVEAAQAERARAAEIERIEGEARDRVTALENELASERAASDQKLNTIMVNLGEDHEADLGKAVEEREEARAEARSLSMRVGVLQKKIEDQRLALDDATRLLAETRTAAQQEIDKLHTRLSGFEKPVVRPRILIAHPDAELRRSAGASLERAGYEIVSAADGLEALRTAIAQSPAVVIADAIMPKMDGRELCQLLKSQEKTAHIRVILLTRATDAPPKGELMPDHVLRKPVPLETLKTTLAALLA
jgi:CheY-like chemotaxis protein